MTLIEMHIYIMYIYIIELNKNFRILYKVLIKFLTNQ